MTFFDKVINQLFSKQQIPEYNGKKYLVQELYSLSKSEELEFETWKQNTESGKLLHSIFQGLQYKIAGMSESNTRYSIYATPQSNGFYILCEDFIETKESKFVLEILKDRIKGMSYYQSHSSKEVYEQNGNIKTTLSYYLKPKLSNYNLPLAQLFGNIHIEMLLINDIPDHIKLMANIYSDRNYQKEIPFSELLISLNSD